LLIDLHTHSNCSDGTLTPAELVSCAAAAGVQVLAVTDHDTVAGLDAAQAAAAQCDVLLVPGVEISASWRAQAIHVLGLWIDPAAITLKAHLAAQAELRRERRTAC
jgi:predicted metal-dependent phosphoesterase TrpH